MNTHQPVSITRPHLVLQQCTWSTVFSLQWSSWTWLSQKTKNRSGWPETSRFSPVFTASAETALSLFLHVCRQTRKSYLDRRELIFTQPSITLALIMTLVLIMMIRIKFSSSKEVKTGSNEVRETEAFCSSSLLPAVCAASSSCESIILFFSPSEVFHNIQAGTTRMFPQLYACLFV